MDVNTKQLIDLDKQWILGAKTALILLSHGEAGEKQLRLAIQKRSNEIAEAKHVLTDRTR